MNLKRVLCVGICTLAVQGVWGSGASMESLKELAQTYGVPVELVDLAIETNDVLCEIKRTIAAGGPTESVKRSMDVYLSKSDELSEQKKKLSEDANFVLFEILQAALNIRAKEAASH